MDWEGILAIVLIFGGGTLTAISFSPIGRAFAERIRGGAEDPAPDPVLYEEIERLRAELSEMGERIDFTERLLARHRDEERMPGGTT
ncbi:MAG: hypothetical protein SGJ01_15665 [Gemmatimonadota bacterium]|nr:hypothetical protein [Gemmatimonadota bacterium]